MTHSTTPIAIHHDSPVGVLTLVADDEALLAVLWPDDADRVPIDFDVVDAEEGPAVLESAADQLDEYFAGNRTDFDLPIKTNGSPFQTEVWDALQRIPYGETRSYGQLAEELGRPGAARAVGTANSKNPVSIVIPCHRVVASDGSLAGFAGGLDTKSTLLELEQRESR